MQQVHKQMTAQQQQQQRTLSQQAVNVPTVRSSVTTRFQCSQCTAASQQHSRRQLLQLVALGMAGLASSAVLPASAAAAVSSSKALEEYMNMEDAGKLKDQRSLDNIRCVVSLCSRPAGSSKSSSSFASRLMIITCPSSAVLRWQLCLSLAPQMSNLCW